MTKAALGLRGSFRGSDGIRRQDQGGKASLRGRGRVVTREEDGVTWTLCSTASPSIHTQGCCPATAQAWPLQDARWAASWRR